MPPKVSVVMSVYKGKPYLRECLESILNQTFTDFEFIIIDDGSTDSTWEILTEYDKRDHRVRIFKNVENIGLTKSLNKGLALAQGEYIARQDADDISLQERFKLQTRFLDHHLEVGAIGSVAEVIDEQGMSLGQSKVPIEHESLQACLLVNNCLYHSSMMARRSLVQALGGYREELRYAQDYDLWLRLSQLARIENLQDILVRVRHSAKNITTTKREEQLLCAFKISIQAVQESLKGQSLAKDAYQRFWWAILRLSDEDAYQRFWFAYHSRCGQLQWRDIQSLWPFWKLLANHPGGFQIWGSRLYRLAHNLLARGQTVEGLQLLSVVATQFKFPIQLGTIVKISIKPYVPPLGYQLWKVWQLQQTRS